MGFFQSVAGLIRLEVCSDSVAKTGPSRLLRLTQNEKRPEPVGAFFIQRLLIKPDQT
jgi:hypothetical protein